MGDRLTFGEIADAVAGRPDNRLSGHDVLRLLLQALWTGAIPERAFGYDDNSFDPATSRWWEGVEGDCGNDVPTLPASDFEIRWKLLELLVARDRHLELSLIHI